MNFSFLRLCSSRGLSSLLRAALKWAVPCKCAPASPTEFPETGAPPFSSAPPSPPQQPRTVLYLTHRFFPEGCGGTETFLRRLALSQQALGSRVLVVTLSLGFLWEYPEEIGGMPARRFSWEGIDVLAIRCRRPPSGLYYERIDEDDRVQADFARRCLALFSPDLVHAVYPQPFAAFLRVCRELSVPYLVTATDFCLLCPRGTLVCGEARPCPGPAGGTRCPPGGAARFSQAERLVRGAARVTVPSVFSKERFSLAFPGLCPAVIPHGTEAVFRRSPRVAVRRFAFFGALNPAKGVLTLFRAFHALRVPGVSLCVCGGGPLRPFLALLCLRDRRIRLAGPAARRDLPALYAQSDCVVIPSLTAESFSLVLSEAAACGCMVIVSDLGALPERARALGGSRSFRAGDAEALSRAMAEAVRAPSFPGGTPPSAAEEESAYEELYRQVEQQ